MTTHPIRIALQLQPQHAEYSEIRDAVVRGEEMGVDVIFNWDHFFPLSGKRDGKHFECWTMLGSWAEITERVEIGALVTCNSYRNPDLLADMARTVDHASRGRLILGIGAGRYTAEYADIWHGFGQPDTIRHKNEVLDRHCQDVGRDPVEIERSCGAGVRRVELGDQLADAGASMITLGFDGDSGFDLGPVSEWLAWRDERNGSTV